MNKRENILSVAGLVLGTAMIILACASLIYVDTQQKSAQRTNSKTVEAFLKTVPEAYEGFIYDRSDVQMPALQIEGEDIVGVVEVPILFVKIPVRSTWDEMKVNHIPSRLTGSIYDKTLIIGGTEAEGQLDFFDDICVGDTVLFTDALGARFEYVLESIDITKELDTNKIGSSDDLTIFAKDLYLKKYTVLHLKLK